MRSTEVERADVYQQDVLVAKLSRKDQGCEFRYLESYGGTGIATSLPNKGEPIATHGDNLPPYFANLLPEGARLAALVNRAKTSPSDMFSLLMETGPDCVGDVYAVPEGEKAMIGPMKSTRSLAEMDFKQALSIALDEGESGTVSGVQDKLSISDSTITIPIELNSAASAILKLSPSANPWLVENEHFFLKVAARCGFKVARTRIVTDRNGVAGLLVGRFDRVRSGGRLHRLHQEDGCQLVNKYPAEKYRISLADACRSFQEFADFPIPENLELLRRQAFAYLMGNGDMHAKNLSLYSPDASNVFGQTPLYDVVCTALYPKLDTRVALAMDGKDDNFKMGDFLKFARRFEIAETSVRSAIGTLLNKFEPWIARVSELPFDPKDVERAQNLMAQRVSKLREA